jgi:hypothetical protein
MYTIVVKFQCDETFTYASDFNGLFDLLYALNIFDFVKSINVFLGDALYTFNDFGWTNLEKWTIK